MQNNDKDFTFLFSHSSKSRIYIRRITVSKRLIQNTSLGVILVFGISLFSIALAGVFGSAGPLEATADATIANAPPKSFSAAVFAQTNQIDDLRPPSVAPNSGGPADLNPNDADSSSVEAQLLQVQKTGDPAFVPSIWAHAGKINNEFGFRRNPFGGRTYEFHAGMDIGGDRGDLVVAPASGTVTKASWQGGYGNLVEVDHGNGIISRYAHLSKIDVEVGEQVQRGQLMAYVGSTGRSTGPHLHYELRFKDKPINPRRFLPAEPTVVE